MPVTINGTTGVDQSQVTGATNLPSGTTAQRPSNPVAGQQRFNTDLGFSEVYNGNEWVGNAFIAEGGSETTITDGGVNYKVHTFTSSGTFSVISGSKEVEYLVVAGGGSGASGRNDSATPGGGGGAGALLEGSSSVSFGNFSIVVGAGGSGVSVSGSPSSGNRGVNSSFSSFVSPGGQPGLENVSDEPRDSEQGGSGGGRSGGGVSTSPANEGGFAGTNGFLANDGGDKGPLNSNAFPGNAGGGGGGAGAAGQDASENNGGNGGAGHISSINGTAVTYAGGGGGAGASAGSGGAGGGGAGSNGGDNGTSGGINTGGGGGGNRSNPGDSGAGGSGIVIIRYQI